MKIRAVRSSLLASVLAPISFFLTSCGTFVPSLTYLQDDQIYTIDVHRSIQCEIVDTIHTAYDQVELPGSIRNENIDFFDDWGLLYTVTLMMVEDTSVNPSLDLISPTTPMSMLLPGDVVFTANTGLKFSSKATRTETAQFFSTVERLNSLNPCTDSPNNKLVPIGRTLGLSKWLITQLSVVDGGLITSLTPKESFTYEVKFEIGKRGNADPKWSIVQRELNTVKGLFNAGRTSTHTVLFTFGPVEEDRAKLEQEARDVHNATLIGNAVAR